MGLRIFIINNIEEYRTLKVDINFWKKISGVFFIILNSFYIIYGVSFYYMKYYTRMINIVDFNDLTLVFFILLGIVGINIGWRVFTNKLSIKMGLALSFLFISIFIFTYYINFAYPWI